MQVNSLLLDYFYEYPQFNFLIPDNHYNLQDTLRKSLNGSNLLLFLNDLNILDNKTDALFFQIHTKFCRTSSKLTVIDLLTVWQKSNPKFKIQYDSLGQKNDTSKRMSMKIGNSRVKRIQIEGSKSLEKYAKFNEKNIEKNLLTNQTKHKYQRNHIKDEAAQQIVSNFFNAVNKSKSHKDHKVVQKSIKQLVGNFIKELDKQNVPFDDIIAKLEQQIPYMNLNEETKMLMQKLIKEHKKNPNRSREETQILLKNLLHQTSNPKSIQKIIIKKIPKDKMTNEKEVYYNAGNRQDINRQIWNKDSVNNKITDQKLAHQNISKGEKTIINDKTVFNKRVIYGQISSPYFNKNTSPQLFTRSQTVPIMTTNTLKVTNKQYESNDKIRKLKMIFQSFSLAHKNRKGLTFDQLTDEFNKMDLNNWMSFNKKYETVAKLGIEEIHMIFKRYCYLGLLDYSRFQKAFKDLSKQLFPEDISKAYVYFHLEDETRVVSKSRVQLPLISQSTEKRELKEMINYGNGGMNGRSNTLKINKSFVQPKPKIRQKFQKSFQYPINQSANNYIKPSQEVKAETVSQLQNKIKKQKTKI